MKIILLLAVLFSSATHAYTFWTAQNPWEVCHFKGGLRMKMMVNSGADIFEFHRFDRDFVSCREEEGRVVLDMNLYHKSANNMEAGMMIVKRLRLPLGFCEKKPDVIRFNFSVDPSIVKNGKFSGPRTLEVNAKCSESF